jgi:hypothetical protein
MLVDRFVLHPGIASSTSREPNPGVTIKSAPPILIKLFNVTYRVCPYARLTLELLVLVTRIAPRESSTAFNRVGSTVGRNFTAGALSQMVAARISSVPAFRKRRQETIATRKTVPLCLV